MIFLTQFSMVIRLNYKEFAVQHSMFNIRYLCSFPEQLHYIIPVGKDKKAEKQHHSYNLGILDKFIAGFAPENDLIQQEHYMPPVKGRYW